MLPLLLVIVSACEFPNGTWDNRPIGGDVLDRVTWDARDPGECADWSCRAPNCAGAGLGAPDSSQLAFVSSPRRQGAYAAKLTIRPGDQDSGARVSIHLECHPGGKFYEGDDRYYALSFFLPDDWTTANAQYQIIQQFHSYGWKYVANPQFNLSIDGPNEAPQLYIASRGGVISWLAPKNKPQYTDVKTTTVPLVKGHWNDVIIHAKWSVTKNGRFEIWHRDEASAAFTKVVDWTKSTLLQGETSDGGYRTAKDAFTYTAYGIYAAYQDAPITIIHDGYRVGETLDAVSADFGCTPDDTPASEPEPTPQPTPLERPTYTALRMSSAEPIDGDVTRYAAASAITIGNDDTSGTYRLTWDDDALYVAAQVNDATSYSVYTTRDAALWEDDSLELMLDTTNDRGATMATDDFKAIVSAINTLHDFRGGDGSGWNGDWQSATVTTDTGYIVELRIPWASLDIATPQPGATLGLEVKLNDRIDAALAADGSAWSNINGGSVNDPDGWGVLELSGDAVAQAVAHAPSATETPASEAVAAQSEDSDSCASADTSPWLALGIVLVSGHWLRKRAR